MRKPLLEALATQLLCCDGAMGTQLMARGMTSGECGMLWNVNRPGDVKSVHDAYRSGGCDLITTNSFGGSASVLGDVGPFGDFLDPLGDMMPDDLRVIFKEQIEALLEGGADAILVETMVDPAEAVVGVEAARLVSATIPVVVTYAFQKPSPGVFKTIMGTTVTEAVTRALDAGADIVGANCGTGLDLDDYVELGRQLVAAAAGKPVILQPNAGAPRTVGDDTVYDASPEQMADTARRLMAAGVRIIGGCCGTTPDHLKAMAAAVHGAS